MENLYNQTAFQEDLNSLVVFPTRYRRNKPVSKNTSCPFLATPQAPASSGPTLNAVRTYTTENSRAECEQAVGQGWAGGNHRAVATYGIWLGFVWLVFGCIISEPKSYCSALILRQPAAASTSRRYFFPTGCSGHEVTRLLCKCGARCTAYRDEAEVNRMMIPPPVSAVALQVYKMKDVFMNEVIGG